MSINAGPNIIEDGLVLALDAANEKSFRGEPTTNVVTNTDLNTGWSQGYQTNIIFNEIDPPAWIDSPTVGHTRGNANGYWYSYGNYAPQVPSTTYTVSLYVKTLDSNFNIRFYTADNSETGRYWSEYINVPNDGQWHRLVWNSFVNASNSQSDSLSFNFYYNGAIGDASTRTWFCAPQMEAKSYATPFVNGTRGSTVATGGGGMDLSNSGNHMELGTVPPQQDSDDGLIFSGVDNQSFQCSSINYGSEGTCIYWLNIADTPGVWNPFGAGGPGYYYAADPSGNLVTMVSAKNAANEDVNFWPTCTGVASLIRDKPSMIALSMVEDSFLKWYVNGSLRSTHDPPYFSYLRFKDGIFRAGQGYSNTNQRFTGKLYEVSYYNRALTDAEILQTFNAKRGRYGI